MRHPPHHIFQFTPETLADWLGERGQPKYRAKQVLDWVYGKGEIDPAKMSNLPAALRDTLASEMTFLSGPTVAHQVATDGTQKLLVEWPDELTPGSVSAEEATVDHSTRLPILGESGTPGAMPYSNTARQTECVMIPSQDTGPTGVPTRRTACISSQVGCPVGCKFCASGMGGLDGNLSAGRIIEQIWRLSRLDGVGRISHIVFMGMGEPLSNFAAVTHAVRTICADWGLGISARRVTISTVGLPKAIERLADKMELPVTLALSLHAPTDELRRELIPWSEYTTIDDLLSACDKWFRKTGREITLEYTLLRGVNDSQEQAAELASLAKRLRANVNIIRYNEVDGTPFKRPVTDDVREFQRILRARSVNAHIRASRGRDIAAACGQLRHEAASAGGA
ncbi:MAG: 23S rRNA (adenine(2503)-C(2))-methyltransferase RlmN [Planctomycetota bacterium]